MRLSTYTQLIKNLPYLDQSFETARSTWNREKYAFSPLFTSFCKLTFQQDTVIISRNDLFNVAKGNIHTALFHIILWGYPEDMRGNNFRSILNYLENSNISLYRSAKLTSEDFIRLVASVKGTGIGLSTLTKFLYFLQISIDGYKCLILDNRIIEVLQSGYYQELTSLKDIRDSNKVKRYLEYLKLIADIANKYEYLVDQLELFLFMFGRNLKSSVD